MRSKIDPRDLRVSMANEFRTRDARISREEERLHAAFVELFALFRSHKRIYFRDELYKRTLRIIRKSYEYIVRMG